MSSSGRCAAAKPEAEGHYKNALTTIRRAVGSTIVSLCIWPGFYGDIMASFNAPLLVTSTSSASNQIHKENPLPRTSFKDRWSAAPAPVVAPTRKKNEHEPQEGGVEKIPFSCELAFSRVVREGNFNTRCIAGIDLSKNSNRMTSFTMDRNDHAKRTGSKVSNAIEAIDLGIRRCLLHQHLSHWHPVSTAPHNQDLEVRDSDENALIKLPFPCRRNNASEWINTDLGTRVYARRYVLQGRQ